MTADIGLLLHVVENVKVGLSFENIIPADFGILTREPIPFNLRMGTSYLHHWENSPYVDSLLGSVELTYRNEIYDIRAGTEAWFFNHLIALRMGTTADNFAAGLSVDAVLPNTPVDVRLDYAFTYPYTIQSTIGSHRFSLVFRWGTLVNSQRRSLTSEELQRLVEPDKDAIAAKEEELRRQREAQQKALKEKLRAYHEELKKSQEALKKIKERIALGELPAIMFESGTSRMKRSSLATLAEIAKVLEKYPQVKVRIEGHTDSVGKAAYNLKLSRERAQAVADHLVSMYKINADHVMAVGYGETRPIDSNKTAEGRRKNRRVEVKVIFPDDFEKEEATLSNGNRAAGKAQEQQTKPNEVAPAADLEKVKSKADVHQLKMDSKEVEKMFNQQKTGNEQQ
jgi:outer membrane protein OmpA-like peptidoglycan-associated protein